MSDVQWRIEIDQSLCQGSGMCLAIAPDHFRSGVGRRSEPTAGVTPASRILLDAAQCCPMEAISLTELDSGNPVHPC